MDYNNDSEEDFIISESGEIYSSKEEGFILNTLSRDSFIICNSKIARMWGVETSIFLSSIISKYKYFKLKNKLSDGGYFFNTAKNIYFTTGLKRYGQERALKILKNLKIVTVKKQGIPPKIYFKIDFKALKLQFVDIQQIDLLTSNNTLIDYNNKIKSYSKKQNKIRVSHETPSDNKVLSSGKDIKTKQQNISAKLELHPFATKALSIWNTLPNVTHHKKPSKTWLNVIKSLNILRFGKLYKNQFDKDFLKKYNISEDTLKFKFSKQEIIITLKKVSEWCQQGFLIRDKNFPTSLPNAIYNSRSYFKSIFLIARSNDLKPAVQKIENKFPETTDYFQKKTKVTLSDRELNQLCRTLNSLFEYHKTYISKKAIGYRVNQLFGDFKSMCKTFIDWLVDSDKTRNIDKDFKYSVFGFKPDSIMFRKFIKYYEKTINCCLSPLSSRF